MRNDAGVNGDAQRLEQMTWLLFLKVYDAKESEWELLDDNYKSIIDKKFRWRNWAVDDKDGKALTGDDLLSFINTQLFPSLKNIAINEKTPFNKRIVKFAFEDNNNYMKDGILLRQVVNVIDEIDFNKYEEKHAFNEIYEKILKDLQSAGHAGEFYTPRAVTDFMVKMINPKLGDKIADFACGTGGFLISSLNHLKLQSKNVKRKQLYNDSVYGIEKKALPYLLCATNLLLHDVDNPKIIHENSLEKNVKNYKDDDKFNIVIMNPPFGGSELKSIQNNFPSDLRSSETADLFVSLIIYRTKHNARAAVILPDGFLFEVTNSAKIAIKEKLLKDFNLHTIIRLPKSVFAPYASITTNLLFFDKTHPTKETWFYRMDMPKGYKHFSKTKPITLDHFTPVIEWWNNRIEIKEDGFDKAKKYTVKELKEKGYNLDLCGYPHIEEIILEPKELISQYKEKKARLNADIDKILAKITEILEDK
jgi:type I restriction enzyme M protein